jgi:hypothetical protein
VVAVGLGMVTVRAQTPEVAARQLAPFLLARAEVQFLRFTTDGRLIIGGVSAYEDRAGADDSASRLTWKSRVPANWVEWNPADRSLRKMALDLTPRNLERANKDRLAPVFPGDWVPGERGVGKVSRPALAAALRSGSAEVTVRAVSPTSDFVAATLYESAADGLGALVFVRKEASGWRKVNSELGDAIPNETWFSPDGQWMACRYQPNGYDGPEPWVMVSTRTGKTVMPGAGMPGDRRIYALTVRGGGAALGWSDGAVSRQRLDGLRP